MAIPPFLVVTYTYDPIFFDPEMLRLFKYRRTVYDIIEGGLPTNPINKINIDVNFTDPDWQAVFGVPIVNAFEYFGESILETILSETACLE